MTYITDRHTHIRTQGENTEQITYFGKSEFGTTEVDAAARRRLHAHVS